MRRFEQILLHGWSAWRRSFLLSFCEAAPRESCRRFVRRWRGDILSVKFSDLLLRPDGSTKTGKHQQPEINKSDHLSFVSSIFNLTATLSSIKDVPVNAHNLHI